MMSKRRFWISVATSVFVAGAFFFRSMSLAQDAKPPDTPKAADAKAADTSKAAEPAKAADATKPADAAAKPTEVAVAMPPALPDYFTATNPTEKDKPAKWPDNTGGNAGAWATPASDGTGDVPAKMTNPDLYDRIVHNMFSINIVWTLVTGFLVMFMQAGFAMVETGLCRAKNASHTFSMNFMIYPLGCIAFWVYGFAIGWGNLANGPSAARQHASRSWSRSFGPQLGGRRWPGD